MSEADINNKFPIEPEQSLESDDSTQNIDDATVEEQDKLLPSVPDSDNSDAPEIIHNANNQTDWFAVAHKLRRYNRDLIKQVANLEQNLLESHKQMQAQVKQQASSDTIVIQQTEELRVAKEQMANLCQEVESYHQSNQRQQILVETLSEQLEASQEQVAQLERECAFLQQQCNEQSHLLVQNSHSTDELRSRLYRQQRQALQFKAALEKCLEVRQSGSVNDDCLVNEESETSDLAISASTFVPKVQPIKPWSNQFNQWENQDEQEEESLDSTLFDAPTPPVTENSSESLPEEPEATTPLEIVKVNTDVELTNVSVNEGDNYAENPEEAAQFLLLDDFLLDAEFTEEEEELDELENTITSTQAETEPVDESPEELKPVTSPLEGDLEPQAHSPSPVLYPLRSKKKRNSLASVELPAFGRALSS